MDNNAIIAESFGCAVTTGFDEYLEKHATSVNTEIKVDEDALVESISEKWLKTQIPEMGNITPAEYIDSLTSLDELMSLFKSVAAESDVGVPIVLIDKMKTYGRTAADMLYTFVQDSLNSHSESEDSILAVAEAVYVIGCFRLEEYKSKLIGLLIQNFKSQLLSAESR